MKPTALVTGANGFLGRYTCQALASRGFAVTGIGHGTWHESVPSEFGIANWLEMDVNTKSLIRHGGKPQIVVHCAGSGSVGMSMQHPQKDFQNSVGTLSSVLEYLRVHSPNTVLVFPSSAAVYGGGTRLPIAESSELKPISAYGYHKVMAEQLCQLYASKFGISISVIRFFSLYGEGLEKQLLWDACVKHAKGDHKFMGTGEEIRDWIHVEDAVELVMFAIERCSKGCLIVNGGSGTGFSVKQVLGMLYSVLGSTTTPDFSGENRMGDPSAFYADVSITNSWGYTPKTRLVDGIERYVHWFEQRGS